MSIWVDNIEKITLENETFRTVLYTSNVCQLTVMSVLPGDDIGLEMHSDVDQFIRIEQGTARVTFGPDDVTIKEEYDVANDWAFIIPAGTWHNVVNTGSVELKLYSIYSPANHPVETVHLTKHDAEIAEAEEFDHAKLS